MRTMQEILEAAGYSPEAYGGRGMGGEECLAVTLDNGLGAFFAEVLVNVREDEKVVVAAAFLRMREDSLGRGTVVYFPGVEFKS